MRTNSKNRAWKIVVLLFLSLQLNAQQNWLSDAGGNANDEAMDLVMDNTGCVYTTGYFSQSAAFGALNINSSGSGDVFIAKQDANGNYLWVTGAGGLSSDRGLSISLDAFGNIFVTGTFSGSVQFGSIPLTSSGLQDVFVAKLDGNGNYLWVKQFGGTDNDVPYGITNDANGNIFLTGQFQGSVTFGTQTLTSEINPVTNSSSYDIFILKLNPNGSVSWVKQGSAKFDDRGMSIAVNALNQVVVCGQYSDTLNLNLIHNNNAYNAGFLTLLDTAGNEIWFRRLAALQLSTYDVQTSGTDIFLTGDIKGNLIINTSPSTQVLNTHTNGIFLLKFNSVGNVVWSALEGSENVISSRVLSIDGTGNIYTAGFFKCSLTSFSSTYGSGIFYSAGYRDIFMLKYNTGGQRIWEKHAGGPGDDYCNGIGIIQSDKPVICGSYARAFATPGNSSFLSNTSSIHYLNGNGNLIHCAHPDYGNYITVESAGFKDIYSGKIYDPAYTIFDYFERTSVCNNDTLVPFINQNQDTLFGCDSVIVVVDTRTTEDGLNGPEYDYLWSGNSTNDTLVVYQSGWVYLNLSTKDDCRSYSDSVYVVVYPVPATPVITSTYGTIQLAIPAFGCYNKLALMQGDTATLIAGNLTAGYTFRWITPQGIFLNQDSIRVWSQGVYSLEVESPAAGCVNSSCVGIFFYQLGNVQCTQMVPQIVFPDSLAEATDTVHVCKEAHFSVELVDSTLYANGFPTHLNTFAQWTISGGYAFDFPVSSPITFSDHLQAFKALSSGNASVTATIMHPLSNAPLLSVTRNFYLDVHEPPVNVPVINGPAGYCPGDTVFLTAGGGDNYLWSGGGIVSMNSDSSVVSVVMEGEFSIHSFTIDSVLGCRSDEDAFYNLLPLPDPIVTMNPAHGVICPGDSVLLTAEPGTDYFWFGPNGSVISTSTSVYVHVSGDYHYNYINQTGCNLVSEYAEINQYSTPYIETEPGASLCANGPVQVSVQTNASAQIQWNAPLSGSGFTQMISSPGTYSASVNFCNINTTATIEIISSNTLAQIFVSGNDTLCYGDSLVLMANPGMSDYSWLPEDFHNSIFVVTAPGTYYLQTYDENGCIGGDSLVVFYYPEVAAPTVSDTSVCAGNTVIAVAHSGFPVSWSADLSGNIIATGDSIVVVPFSDTVFYASSFNGVCYSDLTAYTISIGTGSVIPAISINNELCFGDTLFVNANNPDGLHFHWEGPNGFSADTNVFYIPFQMLSEGNYVLSVSDSLCAAQPDTFEVVVHQPVLQYWNSDELFFCAEDTLLIIGDTLSGNYSWNTGQYGAQIIGNFNQQFWFTFTDTSGCSVQSDTVLLSQFPVPVPVSISDTAICPNEALDLFSPSGENLIWYDQNGNWISDADTLMLSDLINSTEYIFQYLDTNGCLSSSDTLSVTITPVAPAPLILSDTLICEGENITIASDTTGVDFHWSGPGGFSSNQSELNFTPVAITDSGTYLLFVQSGSCVSDTTTFVLTVNEFPELSLSGVPFACEGDSVTIEVNSDSPFAWNTGSVLTEEIFHSNEAGTYTVTATNECGSVTENVLVYFNPLPVANAGSDHTINAGTSVQLNGSGGDVYSWFPATDLSCSDCADPVSTPQNNMIYTLTVTDANGCVASDTMRIDIEYFGLLFIPNSFTPNGDGLNDEFRIALNETAGFRLFIFNRWGEKVYDSNSPSEGWDGSFKNQPAPSGVYVYSVEYINSSGEEQRQKGNLTLIR